MVLVRRELEELCTKRNFRPKPLSGFRIGIEVDAACKLRFCAGSIRLQRCGHNSSVQVSITRSLKISKIQSFFEINSTHGSAVNIITL